MANESSILLGVLAWLLLSVAALLLVRMWQQPSRRPILWPHEPGGNGASWHTLWQTKDAIFALGLGVVVLLLMGPWVVPAEGLRLSTNALATNLVFQLSLAGLVLLYSHWRGAPGVSVFGLRSLPSAQAALTAAVILVPTLITLVAVTHLSLRGMEALGLPAKEQVAVLAMRAEQDPTLLFLFFLGIVVGAPLMEELVFRGIFFRVLARYSNVPFAAFFSAGIFAVIHNNALSLIPLFILGLIFAIAYERTRSLLVPIFMHSFFNAMQFSLMRYGSPS